MSQSLAQIYVHIIFSTKDRYPFINDFIEPELFAYMADMIKRCGGFPFLINGTADHVHLLSSLPRTMSLSKFIEEIKRNSSRWIKGKGREFYRFNWQSGYGAFSVSSSKKKSVQNYITNQKEHHRGLTFKEEFISFLKKYNIKYNEEYLWN